MRVVILGAGLAGLSTSYHLLKRDNKSNLSWNVYEATRNTGGLCNSIEQDGFTFDYTGHLLHFRTDYAKQMVEKLLDDNLNKVARNSSIYSNDIYTRYPFQANLYGLPFKVLKKCLLDFIEAYMKRNGQRVSTERKSFSTWVSETFGEGIANYFMIPYNQKLWTIDPSEMACDWMQRFVPDPTISEVITGALKDNMELYGYNAIFYYPLKGGIKALIEAIEERIPQPKLNHRAISVDLRNKRVYFENGASVTYDYLVSTIPLKIFAGLCNGLPFEIKSKVTLLKSNNVLNINLGIDRKNVSNHHWVYFPEKKYIFYRVGFPMNFSPYVVPENKSSMYIEIAYRREEELNEKDVVETAIRQLIDIGILRSKSEIITTMIAHIENAYVIYDFNRKQCVSAVKSYLEEMDVYSIGRFGSWEYSSMEDAILVGKLTAEGLLKELTSF